MKPRRSGIPVKSTSPRARPKPLSQGGVRSLFPAAVVPPTTSSEIGSTADSVRKYHTEETPLNLSSTNLSVLTFDESEKKDDESSESSEDDQLLLDKCIKVAWAEKNTKSIPQPSSASRSRVFPSLGQRVEGEGAPSTSTTATRTATTTFSQRQHRHGNGIVCCSSSSSSHPTPPRQRRSSNSPAKGGSPRQKFQKTALVRPSPR